MQMEVSLLWVETIMECCVPHGLSTLMTPSHGL